ncbi:hypothetical protein [Pseudorhodoferax sp.]|uniref:hypothetical protein n=1 Tax=Pseudorhodoferax sp. TaxID=1993553 RepID=UPI0039E41A5B
MRFLRGLGLFIAITCLVWVGVLWHWQATRRDMSVEDIVVYLGALPLVLFVLVLAARWAWRGAAAKASAAAAAVAAPAAPAAQPAAGADEAARHATMQLLAAHVCCAAAASVDELLGAAEAGQPRPALQAGLLDAGGLPVLAAAVAEPPLEAATQALEEAAAELARLHPADTPAAPSETLVRALVLLAAPLADAVAVLAAWPGRLLPPERLPGQPAQPASHRVRVLPAWPAGLPEAELALARAWLRQQLLVLGEGLVHPDAWVVQPGGSASGPELWLEADRLHASLQREGLDDPLLLLACHSDVTEAAVRQLGDAGQLFGSACPKGVIPGEAAAALLLAGPDWPPAAPDAPPYPHLHRAAVARRDKSVDAAGRTSADLAAELLRQALAAARLAPDAVAGLADDADQHSARAPELYGAMVAQLPHLDAAEDHRMAGHLLGRAGAAGTLAAVAMAARCAAAGGKPWLALAVGDAHWRLALVARPEAPPPADDGASTRPGAAGEPPNKNTT